MDLQSALPLAQLLAADLTPGCDRLEIAGSVRRGRAQVHDVEIVAIPARTSIQRTDMFGEVVAEEITDLFEERLRLLQDGSGWDWCLDKELPRNGPRYKRFRSKSAGICADVFLCDARGWGGAMAMRTGPADFSQALVTLARRRGKHVADGYLVHGHPKPRRAIANPTVVQIATGRTEEEYPCAKGEACPLILPTPEELAFFAALGLPWIEPGERRTELMWKRANIDGR